MSLLPGREAGVGEEMRAEVVTIYRYDLSDGLAGMSTGRAGLDFDRIPSSGSNSELPESACSSA